jgi:DNA polymerase I
LIDQDLKSQFSIVREATEALNIPYIAQKGVEADDLIATYTEAATKLGHRVTVMSPDKDMLQLVSFNNVTIVDPSPGKNERAMDRDAVKLKWGVEPEQIPDLQAIIGDKVDNSTFSFVRYFLFIFF